MSHAAVPARDAAVAVLAELKAAGVAVEARGEKLRLSPATRVDAGLMARVRPLKASLLAILTVQPPVSRPVEEHPLVARAMELFSARIVKVGRPPASEIKYGHASRRKG